MGIKTNKSIWYSYMGFPYKGNSPPYYNLAGTPWFDELNKNIPVIREKVLDLLAGKNADLKTYFNTGIVEGGKWEARGFLSWGMKDKLLDSEKGREVFNMFKNIPGLVLLSVSILRPHTRVKPHNGDTDATYRLHIPVSIPAGLPVCGLRVAGIDKPWKEDEITAFSDANLHEAWNMTNEARIILIADVVREELTQNKKNICMNVLALLSVQKIFGILGIPLSEYGSSKLPVIMIPPLRVLIRLYLLFTGKFVKQ